MAATGQILIEKQTQARPDGVHPAQPQDQQAIRQVVAAAFGRQEEADLVDALRAAGDATIELVFLSADEVVGHVLLSPLQLEPDVALSCLGLAPLSVSPERQGRGLGSQLMQAALEAARDAGTDAIFLLGNPAYYSRFGFTRSRIGNEYGATDAFMALALTPGCLDPVQATARYASAFRDTGV